MRRSCRNVVGWSSHSMHGKYIGLQLEVHRYCSNTSTRRALGRAHLPPTKSSDGSVNKSILKPRLALAARSQHVYVGFSRCKIPRRSAARWKPIGKGLKAAKFRSLYDIEESNPVPDYDPGRAQKLISSSMSRHLSTRNSSSKSIHAFSSNLANRQTEKHGQKHVPPPLSEVVSKT